MLFAGCGSKSAVKGEEIFSCNPDNMLGLESITAVTLAKDDSYKVDFEAGVINAQCHGGDCTEFFEQTYNSALDSWGAAKQETRVEPETSGP